MIISRKDLNKRINKAVIKERKSMLDEMLQRNEMDNMWRRIHDLESRMYKVEHKDDKK